MRPLHHRMLRLVPVVLLLASASAASAQSNTISILQDGSGNTLTVDQSDASGSTVGGLTLKQPSPQVFTQIIETTLPADENNPEPRLRRETVQITLDTLSAVQRPEEAARQIGRNNSADVSITGTGGFVGLLQDSASSQEGNTATVDLAGDYALVGQRGSGNNASIFVAAGAAGGEVLQDGFNNTAGLTVSGAGSTGLISQVGNGLTNNLDVSGRGTNASLYATGVGLANVTNGVTVVSNGATVSITQNPM